MPLCRLCRTVAVELLLDLGRHPVTNRYAATPKDPETSFRIALGQCRECGLLQLIEPVPAADLIAPYEWITYTEAEGHLDRVAGEVATLPGVVKPSVCGVSYKDDTLLERLRQRGLASVWRIEPEGDLGVSDSRAGLESIQDRLSPESADAISRAHGLADIVVARHILEHAHDTPRFMRAIRHLMNPGGYAVFEVPDCRRAFETLDYTTVWEEHILYFTPATFRNALALGGFEVVAFECYPYVHENSLVAIARSLEAVPACLSAESGQLEEERERAHAFATAFPDRRSRVRELLRAQRQRGKIAILGAGHLACAFINFLGLKDEIAFVIDDNPHKRGMYLPGSRLPVRGSDALLAEHVALCLLSVNPESEARVRQRNQAFLAAGGTFASIFPASGSALSIQLEGRQH